MGFNPCSEFTLERTCWDPKDGELCLNRSRPEETLVEDRSGFDVRVYKNRRFMSWFSNWEWLFLNL